VVAFIEQVQNIEKSTASVVEVVSYFATMKVRIQERQSDLSSYHVRLNQVKSELRKLPTNSKLNSSVVYCSFVKQL